MTEVSFAKGHGTQNDFIIIEDYEAQLDFSAQQISVLCDRRAGLGADGVLRVAPAGRMYARGELDSLEGIAEDTWFMDYRNADGSLAEMCGNGSRVFAHWLRSRNLETSDNFMIGTRAGAKRVSVQSCDALKASVCVEMGPAEVLGISQVCFGTHRFTGLAVDVGNPHVACIIPSLTRAELATLPIDVAPGYDTDFFPHGVNVEIATPLQDGNTVMRVHERGVGETRSCGTGTVATARAALADAGLAEGAVTVAVPGGQVEVTIEGDSSTLTGPSTIVAVGTFDVDALAHGRYF